MESHRLLFGVDHFLQLADKLTKMLQRGKKSSVPIYSSISLQHIVAAYSLLFQSMEKRSLGIILSVLGVVGLIIAAVNFINGGSGGHHIRGMLAFGILGILFFTAGVSLVRTTKDKPS